MPEIIRKHAVTFYSPGTMFDEESTLDIETFGDIRRALDISKTVVARYGARPFAFEFTTTGAPPSVVAEGQEFACVRKEIARSGRYFIGAVIESAADVEARNDPRDLILRDNMRCNGWSFVARTQTPFVHVAVFKHGDVNVDPATGEITHTATAMIAAFKRESEERRPSADAR